MNPIYDLLRSDGSIVINKNLISSIGLNESIMFCELLSRYHYFADRNQLQEDGSFFNTIFDLSLATGLADKAQRTTIAKLTKLGLISVTKKGIPAKRYFRINENMNLISHYLQEGANKRKELIEKHRENPVNITVLPKAETCYPQGKELVVAEGVRNNTNYNNTKKDTKLYINLPIDEHIFFNIYDNYYRTVFGKPHMRLTEEQLSDVRERIDTLTEFGVDEESFEDAVREHFENLPESNNGNIIAFLTASRRYFDVQTNAW